MLRNFLFNILFTFDSLAPALVVYALSLSDKSTAISIVFILIAVVLTGLSLLILYFIPQKLSSHKIQTEETKSVDKEPLCFLLAYLWPFITRSIGFTSNAWVFVFVIFVFAVCFYQTSAFIFNPVLTLLGYHFYEIKSGGRVKTILISRNVFSLEENTLSVCELSNNVWFDLGNKQ